MTLLTISLTIGLLVIATTLELTNNLAYGKLLLDENILTRVVDKASEQSKELNQFNQNMIYLGKLPYISTCNSPLAKYHISNVGRIPRWSKATKIIDQAYKSCNKTTPNSNQLEYYL